MRLWQILELQVCRAAAESTRTGSQTRHAGRTIRPGERERSGATWTDDGKERCTKESGRRKEKEKKGKGKRRSEKLFK